MCCSPIFMRLPGIRHSAVSKTNSLHSQRNSPGTYSRKRMKMGEQHIVPLARQVIAILRSCSR